MESFIFAPQASQFTLSTVLQTLSSVILLVYLSLALGCSAIALSVDLLGRINVCKGKEDLAAKCIQIATGNFGVGFLFGVVPSISIWFAYTQFLFKQHTPVNNYFLWATFFNLVGLLFLNKYRDAFAVKKFVHGDGEAHEVLDHAETSMSYTGILGVSSLLTGGFFLIGGFAVAVDPGLWEHGFIVIFTSIQVWLKYTAFLCGALGVAGVAMIFYFLSWNGGIKHITDEIREAAILCGSTLAIGFIPLYVIFTGLHLKFIPRADFSVSVIVYSCLAIFVLFVTLHMVYYALVHKNKTAGLMTFVLVALSFLFVVMADNATRENALRKQTYELIKHSPKHH